MNNNTIIPLNLIYWYFSLTNQYPWRTTKDPYRIWLSEIMLQQTQVLTVIPYYERWLSRFPTLRSVAVASVDEVLKAWEGLGYYARARNFHLACKTIYLKYNKIIPNNFDEFIKLPGVGDYTASAVMSIAHDCPIPAIDCNVVRVISRLQSISQPYSQSINLIRPFLLNIIPHDFPGDFNQALMDLGRNICKPKNPNCSLCPIKIHCTAHINKTVNNFPIKPKTNLKPKFNVAVGVVWKNDKILISKRPNNGLLGGLWEFPGGKMLYKETAKECIIREIKEELLIDVMPYERIDRVQHSYSHFSIKMDAYHCKYINGKPKPLECSDVRWIKPDKLKTLPFPRANHKIFTKILNYKVNFV